MATPTTSSTSAPASTTAVETTGIYQEGIVAGLLGALTVAAWFLVIDVLHGRPFYTPTVLGSALFRRGAWPAPLETLPASFEMVVMFTWVHLLAFAIIGVVAARLVSLAESNASLGFGFVLLFVILEACFTVGAMIVAEPVLHALTWPAILVANLLAAVVMAGYFWLRHRTMPMLP